MIWLWVGIVGAFTVVGILAFCQGVMELPPCVKGCHLDLHTGVMWHSPGCPNFERAAEEERDREAEEDDAEAERDAWREEWEQRQHEREQGDESDE